MWKTSKLEHSPTKPRHRICPFKMEAKTQDLPLLDGRLSAGKEEGVE